MFFQRPDPIDAIATLAEDCAADRLPVAKTSTVGIASAGVVSLSQQIDQRAEIYQQQANPPQRAIGSVTDHDCAGKRDHHQCR